MGGCILQGDAPAASQNLWLLHASAVPARCLACLSSRAPNSLLQSLPGTQPVLPPCFPSQSWANLRWLPPRRSAQPPPQSSQGPSHISVAPTRGVTGSSSRPILGLWGCQPKSLISVPPPKGPQLVQLLKAVLGQLPLLPDPSNQLLQGHPPSPCLLPGQSLVMMEAVELMQDLGTELLDLPAARPTHPMSPPLLRTFSLPLGTHVLQHCLQEGGEAPPAPFSQPNAT